MHLVSSKVSLMHFPNNKTFVKNVINNPCLAYFELPSLILSLVILLAVEGDFTIPGVEPQSQRDEILVVTSGCDSTLFGRKQSEYPPLERRTHIRWSSNQENLVKFADTKKKEFSWTIQLLFSNHIY